jgi:hypothetical protein
VAGCAFGSSSVRREAPLLTLQRRDFQVPRIRVSGTNRSASAGVKRTSHVHFKCRSVQTCEAGDTIATQRGWGRCAPSQNSTGATLHESLCRNSASSARYILNVLSASSSALCLRPLVQFKIQGDNEFLHERLLMLKGFFTLTRPYNRPSWKSSDHNRSNPCSSA